MATAVARGLSAVAGVLALVGAQVLVAPSAGAATATPAHTAMVVRDSIDVGLAGTVGVVAVVVGAVGLVYGLTRRHRQSLARRAEERANQPTGS
jgi:membrane protein DedA with SNARE-associated domain